MKKYVTIIFVLLIFQNLSAQKVYPQTTIALTNAQIVDVVGEKIFPGTILIKNGLIAQFLQADQPVPSGYTLINLESSYVMPGMIDVHTHLNNLASAKIALLSGVTTVRSASVPAFQDVSLEKMVFDGHLEGPDVVPAGIYITPHLGETILADPRLAHLTGSVDGEEELRHLVRINIDRGAKVIKTRGTERAGLPETDPRKQTYTREQLEWVVDEAAKSNVPVMIHAHGDDGARAAVEAGAKSIEHGTFLSEKTLALMKEKDVFLVPTYITLLDLVEPGGDYDNPVIHMRGKYMIPKSQQTFKTAYKLGVRIATGADNRYTYESTSRVSMEVEEFRKMGMSAWDALKTTTTSAAELLGLENITGQISVGYEADLIALPDNPLTDPKALQDVVVIISNGHVVINRLPFGKE